MALLYIYISLVSVKVRTPALLGHFVAFLDSELEDIWPLKFYFHLNAKSAKDQCAQRFHCKPLRDVQQHGLF